MTMYAILNMVQICLIGWVILFLSCKISEMRYSLYYCIIRYALYDDKEGINWLKKNTFYVWYIFIVIFLIGNCLALIGKFMNNDILYNRVGLMIAMWYCVYIILKKLHTYMISRNI